MASQGVWLFAPAKTASRSSPAATRSGLSRTVNGEGATERFEYDDQGNLRFHTDGKQQVTEHRHDALNRLRTILARDGGVTRLDQDDRDYEMNVLDFSLSL